jgi:DNA-binding phage protein
MHREGLGKGLSGEQNLNIDTMLKVVAALGLKRHAHVPQYRIRRSGGCSIKQQAV